jgi:hypothetical protein
MGHIHVFSALTALEAVRYSGQHIIEYSYISSALGRPQGARTRVANMARRLMQPPLAARLLGGYSLSILAE